MSAFPLGLGGRARSGCLIAFVALAGVSLSAHDMWIEPTSFVPSNDRTVGLRLRVGQDLMGDPLPRDPQLINQFIIVDGSGPKPVVGRDGADPAGLIRLTSPGLAVVGYRSNPSPIVLPAEKFNQYLQDEGLDIVAALRATRHQTSSDAHEIFARCAKSLLLSGPASPLQHDQTLGFTLELVAERNPYSLGPDEDLPVKLLYEGKPLAGALVVAMNRANPLKKVSARSDRNGRVRFHLPDRGMWLIKAVHMIEAPAGSGAEWASFWASLTFERDPGASEVVSK
jgi:uncharacterized GH25 family protein